MVHHRDRRFLSEAALRQLNPFHTFTTSFCKIEFNIARALSPKFPKWPLSL
jgi:hypothetical protein